MEILHQYDIPVNPGILVNDTESVVKAAESFDCPVALKIQSADIPHKSSAGGVALNLTGKDAVVTSFNTIIQNIKNNNGRRRSS